MLIFELVFRTRLTVPGVTFEMDLLFMKKIILQNIVVRYFK